MTPQKKTVVGQLLAIALLTAVGQPARGEDKPIQLNRVALERARTLIQQGHFVDDRKGAWAAHKPSRDSDNEFLDDYPFAEYAKWHLGIDSRHSIRSKAHYKFPFGDFKNVHRCGLLAVKARAHEYGYAEIEVAATQLLQMIDSTSPSRQKRVD